MDYRELHRTAYNELADEYQSRWKEYIPHQTAVLQPFVEELKKNFGPRPRVLDVGCGVGLGTYILAQSGFDVEAIDMAERMVNFARQNVPTAEVHQGDFLAEDIPPYFEGILMSAFVHLFPFVDAVRVLEKAHAALAEDGLCFLAVTVSTFPHEGVEAKTEYRNPVLRYKKYWSRPELYEVLQAANFDILLHTEDMDPVFHRRWMNILAKKNTKGA